MNTQLASILSRPAGAERTAQLAAWIQGLYSALPPVLVGGSAVELYTSGAYVSGDLDFVGMVPKEVADQLEHAGFRKLGRHWVHEAGQLFVEFPGSRLEPSDDVVDLRVGDAVVRVLAPEALIVNCLAAWEHWQSAQDGVNAWLVARSARLDRDRLRKLARKEHVTKALAAVEAALARWRRREPDAKELAAWANQPPSA